MSGGGEEVIQHLLLKAVGLGVNTHTEIQDAEGQLNQLCDQNRGAFLRAVAIELAREDGNASSRHLAGIILKNKLTSPDEQVKAVNHGLYVGLPQELKNEIKTYVVQALGSPVREAIRIASQVLAQIAAIEIPRNEWMDVVESLQNNITNESSSLELKEGSVSALGYLCEELQMSDALVPMSNHILTAIVHAMRETKSDLVRVAATKALYNALPFVEANFQKEADRNFIMTVVWENTNTENENLRVAGFECLVRIVSLYYQFMGPYIETLFQLTVGAIRSSQSEPVTMQAIEFWSTICDEELELIEEAELAALEGRQPEVVCNRFVSSALGELVPALLETLTKQDEDADDDGWDPAMAAGTCLAIVANVVKNDIISHVMPFVIGNISNQDWHFREAAILAFGSILEGPESDKLQKLVEDGIGVILGLLADPDVRVKDTAAWALGRICEHHTALIGDNLKAILHALANALGDDPKVAANACWALCALGQYYEVEADDMESYPTNALSPYYKPIIEVLLRTTERPDGEQKNLRSNAYEALNAMLGAGATDSVFVIDALLPHIIQQLEGALQAPPSPPVQEVIGKYCSLLYVMIPILAQKISNDEGVADKIMQLFLAVFSRNTESIHEEALLGCGAMCNAVGVKFAKYTQAFTPVLVQALRNWAESGVCQYAVGVMGDLCRSLEKQVTPLADDVVTILLENLQQPGLDKDLRGPILSCFGDIALAIEGAFERHLPVVMRMLAQASGTQVDVTDYDLVDYLTALREGIFEAYTGIIQGLRSENKSELFLPYVPGVLTFIDQVQTQMAETKELVSPSVMKTAVGVIGDIAHALGNHVGQMMNEPQVQSIFQRCTHYAAQTDDESLRSTVDWAREMARKAATPQGM
eukprot:TRINITY_DN420_c0_g1_i13.p1 TRINITY_DN420_c0_g1~~TRINITY_DN420_c0_g1_i13.p1  ORF type:complete len:880 (+),score=237.50 TRINITY_DN420_c0_g1_i13:261-2900(+)